MVEQNTHVLVGNARRSGRGAPTSAPQTVEESLLGQGARLSGFMSQRGLRQRCVRLLRSPLRVAELCQCALLPAASGSAVMARAAADSSLRWTRAVARRARAASPAGSGRELGVVETAAAASRSRSTHRTA